MRSLFILLGIYASVSLSAILPAFTPPKVYKVIDATSYMGLGNGRETSTLAKRTQGNVYLCNDPNFTGYCVLITGATSGDASPLVRSGQTSFKHRTRPGPVVLLLQPVEPTSMMLKEPCCGAGSEADVIQKFRSPGFSDLSLIGWDNAGSSFSCIFDGGPPLTVTFP
ncbi:hypothetical protein B0H13DRAFT_2673665 [Mycena leptocephala]|nr:hypothetical protein B0H13DRAFT_2673665 [Mycena leptocephala]